MFNAEKLLGGLLNGAMGAGKGHSHGHGGGGGVLTGAAGMAALGLAIGAFEHFTGQKNAQQPAGIPQQPGLPPVGQPMGMPLPPSAPPIAPPMAPPVAPTAMNNVPPIPAAAPQAVPAAPQMAESDAILLMRAMIAAAYADGMLDQQEMKNIMDKMESVGLDAEERTFILKELSSPASIDAIIGAVNTPALAQQVYAVSLMAIEVDTEQEREYLSTLSKRLYLSEAIVSGVHASLGKPL